MTSLLDALVQSASNAALIVFVRDSKYGMPAVQSLHLIGITLSLATVVILDLRLAGFGMMDWSLPGLQRQLKPWTLGAVSLVLFSGVLIFLGTPSKYLVSTPFRFKMAVLSLALLFHYSVSRRIANSPAGSPPRRGDFWLAGVSLTLWFMVGWAGRAIAFV